MFADVSVAALTAAQAAGTDPVLAANPYRAALKIVPPKNCTLAYASAARGEPLFAGVTNSFVGGDCAANALYVRGLAAGDVLVILEG